ncbi:MAG: hypothetical protein IPG79_05365 [Saprospiraceae bacterium]|nr:hypothetical protein [Saprospiraceae bacterium]
MILSILSYIQIFNGGIYIHLCFQDAYHTLWNHDYLPFWENQFQHYFGHLNKNIFMKTIILIILTIIALGCTRKNNVHIEDQDKIIVNKNFVFCSCVFQANKRLGIEQIDNNKKIKLDGSSEVYFINEGFSIDFDEVEFVSNYLDSLENSGSFKSYNDNSLILAKCLALYNSEN